MNSITLQDSCYCYPQATQHALADVSLTVERGTSYLLCGPTGSGKSTLAQLIAGLIHPTTGRITYDPNPCDPLRESGMVFQFPEHLFFRDSVAEEFKFLAPVPDSQTVQALFTRLGLDYAALASMHPAQLSFGTARLVALCLQFARKPSLLILDEPTIGLDDGHWNKVLALLREAMNPQQILMVITHDLHLMRAISGHVFLMNNGRLRWRGPAEQLLSDASLMQAAGFI